ncbi:Rrf2 family transcriptional regulator [Alkalicoccus urumqiensis]|uniref:Transcriptional regulator n=1 Tax=Alkalicoccus urumqiensis TaxID=1548213 RepID=A0A2P6MIS0_ALKUR|nr:Rrf2 family transcriptional regulator [Alkalicoccus urumqiensis]PRO66171.1 transcriptional regulator [Alkalicoccus urumqiensis]
MKYAKATNYALHTMVYLASIPRGSLVGVRPLAELQGLSSAYLSKILTKLAKDNLIHSSPGAQGGYSLALPPENITFLDIIESVEGKQAILTCQLADVEKEEECVIQKKMEIGEQQLKQYLESVTIAEIVEELDESVISFLAKHQSPERRKAE